MCRAAGFYRSRILPRLMHTMMDSDENRAIRGRVCDGLEGTVVEIGFGSGLNIAHYPDDVHTVHATWRGRVRHRHHDDLRAPQRARRLRLDVRGHGTAGVTRAAGSPTGPIRGAPSTARRTRWGAGT